MLGAGKRTRRIRAAIAGGGIALLCLLVGTIVSGIRPHSEQGIAPTALGLVACGVGILSALLYLTIESHGSHVRTRLAAALTGGGAIVLLGIELSVVGEAGGGANIGQGLVRLIAIGVLLSGVIVGWRARDADVG